MQTKTELTQSQARFAAMLAKAPYLAGLWDMSRAEYDQERVDRFLGVASRGEAIMARFFLGVWCGKNTFDFDFTDAAAVLDSDKMQIVTGWMSAPFWP